MKTVDTGGITFVEPVPGGTDEWYYGMDVAQGDLYEAEELFKAGEEVRGGRLLCIRYPEGAVFEPLPPQPSRLRHRKRHPSPPSNTSYRTSGTNNF